VTLTGVGSIALLGSDFIFLIIRLTGFEYFGASQAACKVRSLPVLDIFQADGSVIFGLMVAVSGFPVSSDPRADGV